MSTVTGILNCVIVFAVVVCLYHLFKFLVNSNGNLRILLEGKPVTVVKDGELCIDRINNETNMHDIFLLLRVKSVSHLGQVRLAILEEDGQLSVFFHDDKDVKYGLPILPEYCEHPLKDLPVKGHYSCISCSHTKDLPAGSPPVCEVCKKSKWVKGNNEIRIS